MTNVAFLNPHDAKPAMSVEAEQLVLGEMLLNPEGIGRIVRAGGSDLFADPLHREIFETAQEKSKLDALVSPVTISDALRSSQLLQSVGAGYLARLAGAAPGASSFKGLVELLSDLRRKRIIQSAMGEASASIAQGKDPAHIVAGRLEAAMVAATEGDEARGPVSMLSAVTTAMTQVAAAYRGEAENFIRSGILSLDHLITGLFPGELVLIGGRPSMGKTGVALAMALNAARAGHSVCIASLEMNPEAMALRALSEATGQAGHAVSYSAMRKGEMTATQVDMLRREAQAVARLPITFLPRHYSDIGALLAGAKQAHRASPDGLKLLVVDYAQLLRSQAKSRYEQITEISIALKALAGQLNVPVVALSQLSRAVEQRDDKRPTLADLRESGQLEQDADAVLFCYRDAYYVERMRPADDAPIEEHEEWRAAMERARNKLEIIVAKQRQGEIGTAHCMFNPALNLIWEGYR